LVLALGGSALSYLLLACLPGILGLWLSRIVAGLFGADIAIFTTVAADLSERERRVRAMGRVGAAFGVGFILGAGVAAGFGSWPVGRLAGIAAVCSALAALLAWFAAPAGLPNRQQPVVAGDLPRQGLLPNFRNLLPSHLRWLFVLMLCAAAATSLWESTFNLFLQEKPVFAYSMSDYGRIAGIVGISIVLVQGLGVGWLAKRVDAVYLQAAGLCVTSLSFMMMALVTTESMLLLACVLYATGQGIFRPSAVACVSLAAPAGQEGATQGIFLTASTLARAIVPPLAGLLLDIQLELPLFSAACIGLLALALLLPTARQLKEYIRV
jgi:DHA1 family tetracycline resistance protein-like MFS transporter